MRNIKYISIFILLLAGCGSNFTAYRDFAGEAGSIDEVAGANSNAGVMNVAGASGKENFNGGGGDLINAGGYNTAGTNSSGGVNNVAGTSGTSNIAGSGGVCTPTVTCDSYSTKYGKSDFFTVLKKSCGMIDDGCGDKLDCGDCLGANVCGFNNVESTPYSNPFDFATSIGDKNICNYGAGCVKVLSPIGNGDPAQCKNTPSTSNLDPKYTDMWFCFNGTMPSMIPPINKCADTNQSTNGKIDGIRTIAEVWCCIST